MKGVYPFFAENFVLPVYDIIRGTSRFRASRILHKTQWLPRREIELLQFRNLRALLRHAYNTVPYYHRVFRERGIRPDDIKRVSDLGKLPPLTKKKIRQNFSDLISRGVQRDEMIQYSTGGSSGIPLKFLITKEHKSWEIGAEYRAYNWAGYEYGDKVALLWGSPVDTSKSHNCLSKVSNFIDRKVVHNAFNIQESSMVRFAEEVRRFKPKIIRGYSSALYIFSQFLIRENIRDIKPKAIVTQAEKLFENERKSIENAFGCTVYDFYGSREVTGIAAECSEHEGYHISIENVFLEILKDNEHASPGEMGQILITVLHNYAMPFVRYEIGDLGKLSEDLCSCGRTLPLMASIEGRTADVVKTKSGTLLVPELFIHSFRDLPVEQFQVIQETLEELRIKIVKGSGYTEKDTEQLVRLIHQSAGKELKIELEFTNSIPLAKSGKRKIVVSRISEPIVPVR